MMSNCPSAEELIASAESLNCNAIASFNKRAVSATCVRVTSLSLPNPRTAESLSSFKSLLIFTEVDAFISTIGAVISSSPSASMSN